MISGEFYLKNYEDWRVVYFMVTDSDDAAAILDTLKYLKCRKKFMKKAARLLYSDALNSGLAYTKPHLRTSVIVISKTTDIWEFCNSFAHEVDHVEKHIARALAFSPYSERASYLVGEIIQNMFFNIFKQIINYA